MSLPNALRVTQGSVSREWKAGDQETPKLVSLSQDWGLCVQEIPLETLIRALISLGSLSFPNAPDKHAETTLVHGRNGCVPS